MAKKKQKWAAMITLHAEDPAKGERKEVVRFYRMVGAMSVHAAIRLEDFTCAPDVTPFWITEAWEKVRFTEMLTEPIKRSLTYWLATDAGPAQRNAGAQLEFITDQQWEALRFPTNLYLQYEAHFSLPERETIRKWVLSELRGDGAWHTGMADNIDLRDKLWVWCNQHALVLKTCIEPYRACLIEMSIILVQGK